MRLCFCKSGARKRLLLSEHEKFEKARNKYSAMNVSMMLTRMMIMLTRKIWTMMITSVITFSWLIQIHIQHGKV